jgi:uncharacterized protein (UPF0276 family)
MMSSLSFAPAACGAPFVTTECTLPVRAGIGLKSEHFQTILAEKPDFGFFEIHAENYMVAGGPFHHYLTRIRELYPLSLHGVGLSIGSEHLLDEAHLGRLSVLIDRYQPQSFSEHLAWASHGGAFLNDLLPLPYNDKTLHLVCDHIDQIQNRLQRQMLLENPATYVEFKSSDRSETDFIKEVLHRTGCGLLLDVNNVYVSCTNHGRDPYAYIKALSQQWVGEIHLAGFSRETDAIGAPLLIDSHGSPIADAVWQLYEFTIATIGATPTLIERDNNIPSLDVMWREANQAEQRLMAQATQHQGCPERSL